jgi:hypothetical protein
MIVDANKFVLTVISALSVLILFHSTEVRSQVSYNTNIIPMGDKEPLMGNTGTGGLNSSGAVYYNPGALTMLKGNSFSLSGSAFVRYRFNAAPFVDIDGQTIDYEGVGYQSIPTSLIFVRSFKQWRFALSVMIPMEFNFHGSRDWFFDIDNDKLELFLSQDYSERLFLVGLSAARPINDKWSVGVTLYGQYYSLFSTINIQTGFVNSSSQPVTQYERQQITPTSLLGILGIHRLGEKWNFGLRVKLPSAHLFGKGSYYSFSDLSYLIVGAPIERVNVTENSVYFRTPMDIRIGVSFLHRDNWKFASDLSYGFPVSYQQFESEEVDLEIDSPSTIRWSFGLERLISDKISMYGGLSIFPSLDESGSTIDNTDFGTLYLGGKMITKHLETSVGMFYSLGSGTTELSDSGRTFFQEFENMGVFFGTNYKF